MTIAPQHNFKNNLLISKIQQDFEEKKLQTFHKILQQAQLQMTAERCQLHESTKWNEDINLVKRIISDEATANWGIKKKLG